MRVNYLLIYEFLIINFWLNPCPLFGKPPKVKKIPQQVRNFFQFPQDNWGNGTLRGKFPDGNFGIIMKNPNDKPEVQFPVQNKKTKTQLEIQIAELQLRQQQTTKQLKLWDTKLKKAKNLLGCLWTADKFGKQFLTAMVEKEKTQEQPDNWAQEYLIKNQAEFNLKFDWGIETFTELISQKIESQVKVLQIELDHIRNQLHHQERKFARLEARRQGKTLLECEYRKSLGCLGENWCENCRINYPAMEANQLKGGAY